MATLDAIALARAEGHDLIEVDPNQEVPACRIVDLGQHLYAQKKAEKKQKSATKAPESKGIRISPRIGTHDLEVRAKAMRKFFEDGSTVRVTVQFKGREITHSEIGIEKLNQLITLVEDVCKVDQPPKRMGKQITTILSPKK